jgi:hypothetical protein
MGEPSRPASTTRPTPTTLPVVVTAPRRTDEPEPKEACPGRGGVKQEGRHAVFRRSPRRER